MFRFFLFPADLLILSSSFTLHLQDLSPFSNVFSVVPVFIFLSFINPFSRTPSLRLLSVVPLLQNLPQVKQVQALRQVKERLQAENRALARVVAKLSQSACSQLPGVDL